MRIINNNIIVSEYSIFEEYLRRDGEWVLVNTVNCEWFMGKWLALEFKIRFWDVYFLDYKNKCANLSMKIWKIDYFISDNLKIINFPTKKLYKLQSQIAWIEAWLVDLCLKIEKWLYDNEVIYIPKLWSSQWWLEWGDIYSLIKERLLAIRNTKVKFIICEDIIPWEIEQKILKKIKKCNSQVLYTKLRNKIKNDTIHIERLRDILKVRWVWEKLYKSILDFENNNSLF